MTPKEDALHALDEATKMLAAPPPWTPLHMAQLRATVDHARSRVELIQELKRPRRLTADQRARPGQDRMTAAERAVAEASYRRPGEDG